MAHSSNVMAHFQQHHGKFLHIGGNCVGRNSLYSNRTSLNIKMLNALLRTTHIHTTRNALLHSQRWTALCLSESLCQLLLSSSSSFTSSCFCSSPHHLITASSTSLTPVKSPSFSHMTQDYRSTKLLHRSPHSCRLTAVTQPLPFL